MQVCAEKTIFMQKAIFYVSRLIAARGVLELTDCHLNFTVAHLDSSFGMKSVSIDLATVDDVRIEGGDLHPRVIISSGKRYEFVLSKAQELYDHLKQRCCSSVTVAARDDRVWERVCECGRPVDSMFLFCPWCGASLGDS